MNLTSSHGRISARRNVKAQYIAAAGGLAIAVAALVGIGTWQENGPAATGIPAQASVSPASVEQRPSQHVTFIAGSEQQAVDYAASVYQDLNPAWFASYSFVVVTSPEEEARVQYGLAQALAEDSGVSLKVVDLRTP